MPETEGRQPAPVIRLHPVRTLVVSRDLAFRQRAVTVLGDLGVVSFAVASPCLVDDVVALLEDEHPNVVVLDASGCCPSVATVVCQLSEVAPNVGVVLVTGREDRCVGLHTLDKWGWAEELSRAVRAAYHDGNPPAEEQIDGYHHSC
jgi:hypothetical protein